MLPVLLVAVDNTVLAFALPMISEALQPSGTALLWIVDVYPLVLAGLLVAMGSMADRFGRRRLLLIGATGFAAISGLAAFAPTAGWLIAARAAMGVFGAMLMPATLSIIRNLFTDASKRRRAIAIWASGFSGGAALGPIVGGFLLEHLWWGSVFLMAVPVLLPLLIAGPLLLPESRDPEPGPVDGIGIVLSMLTMVPLVWGIKRAVDAGAGLPVVAAVAMSFLAGALFVVRQLRRETPMLDVRLFRQKALTGSVLANLLSVFSLVGFLFFISQHLQLVSGRSPMAAGLVLLPGMVVTILAGLAVVPLVRRVPTAKVVAGGLLLNAVGYGVILATAGAGSDLGLLTAFVILGAGVGASETISNDVILASVPPAKAGAASAISETAYEVGAVLGTAVLGGILTAAYQRAVVLPVGLPVADAIAARETLGGATRVAAGLPAGQAEALLSSARLAFDSGVVWTAAVGLLLMIGAAAMVLRMLRDA